MHKNIRTFDYGGIHPIDNKKGTKDIPIKTAPLPSRVIIPLSQHIGRPARPIVSVGEEVKTGQKIAEQEGYISAAIHASISGSIKSIEKRRHPLGTAVLSIEIESDGKDTKDQSLEPLKTDSIPKEIIIQRIKDAGIVGLGGAAFPTHVKLIPPEEERIDTLIINGAECEPMLTCDFRSMLEKPHELVRGIAIILSLFNKDTKAIIAIEENKREAFNVLDAIIKHYPQISLQLLKIKYPQGAE
ncbi:RnfABCDGE type electron transport complex subunit C, partial [Chlamydiota bacterium]